MMLVPRRVAIQKLCRGAQQAARSADMRDAGLHGVLPRPSALAKGHSSAADNRGLGRLAALAGVLGAAALKPARAAGDRGLEIAPGKDVDDDPELQKVGNAYNAGVHAPARLACMLRCTPLNIKCRPACARGRPALGPLSSGQHKVGGGKA